jgi:hypothetical protein
MSYGLSAPPYFAALVRHRTATRVRPEYDINALRYSFINQLGRLPLPAAPGSISLRSTEPASQFPPIRATIPGANPAVHETLNVRAILFTCLPDHSQWPTTSSMLSRRTTSRTSSPKRASTNKRATATIGPSFPDRYFACASSPVAVPANATIDPAQPSAAFACAHPRTQASSYGEKPCPLFHK